MAVAGGDLMYAGPAWGNAGHRFNLPNIKPVQESHKFGLVTSLATFRILT
jgi:hypothetical protein